MTDIKPVLEPEAAEFAKATDTPPFLFQLPPDEGRTTVDEVQSGEIDKPAIDEEWITVEGGPTGSVKVRIVKPAGTTGTLPVLFFIHGAGWVFGNAHTHDRLVRELAVGADAAVVFPDYDLSPEAKYPTAIEQNYAAAQWVFAHGAEKGLDATRFAAAWWSWTSILRGVVGEAPSSEIDRVGGECDGMVARRRVEIDVVGVATDRGG